MPTMPPTLSVVRISPGEFTPSSQSESQSVPGFVGIDDLGTAQPQAPVAPLFSLLGHFVGVPLQQGRVQLDNDWNETTPRKEVFPPPPPFAVAAGVNLHVEAPKEQRTIGRV